MPRTIIRIDSFDKLDALVNESHTGPVFLYKHSDTCGISLDMYEQLGAVNADINILVVQHDRAISNAVAEKLGIRHASPQAFVLRDGKPVYHATHYGIDPDEINKYLSEK